MTCSTFISGGILVFQFVSSVLHVTLSVLVAAEMTWATPVARASNLVMISKEVAFDSATGSCDN